MAKGCTASNDKIRQSALSGRALLFLSFKIYADQVHKGRSHGMGYPLALPHQREASGRVMPLPYGWTVRVLKNTLSLRGDRRSPWQSPVGFGTLPQSEIRDFRQPPQRGGRERVRIVGVGVLDDPLATVQILPAGRPEAVPYERDCHCASAHTLAPSNEGAVSFR